MRNTGRQFWSYVKLLFKKWILWLFVVIDIIGFISDKTFPQLTFPLILYGVVVIIGLLWASFQVYRELFAQIPMDLPSPPPKPELLIEFIDGSEYSYSLLDPRSSSRLFYKDVDSYEESNKKPKENKESKASIIPDASIVLNLRVSNVGSVSVNIISVFAGYDDWETAWNFWLCNPLDSANQPLSFPASLKLGDNMLCYLRTKLQPKSSYNDAQFIARLIAIGTESPLFIKSKIQVEATDSNKRLFSFEKDYKISLKPLKDLYINLLQNEDRL